MEGQLIERAAYVTGRIHDHSRRLAELSDERTRIVRTLRDKHAVTYRDISEKMGVSPQAVQKAYFRLLPEDKANREH